MPKARPDLPTLYEVVTSLNFDKMFPQDEPFDENTSEWQKCERKKKSHNMSASGSRHKGMRRVGKTPTKPPAKKNQKNRKKKGKKLEDESDDEFEQKSRFSFTLKDFLPKGFLEEESE